MEEKESNAMMLESIAWAFINLDSTCRFISSKCGWSDDAKKKYLLRINRVIDGIRPIMQLISEDENLGFYNKTAPDAVSMAMWLEQNNGLSSVGELAELSED